MKIPFGSQILFEEAEKQGLQPKWETKFGLFSFQKDGKIIYVYSTKLQANSSLGGYLTRDKYTSRVILEKNHFPNIPYLFTTNPKEVNHFFDQHHPLIAKPVFGERAQSVQLITDRNDLTTLPLDETLFEKYIVGTELRYLVLQGKIIAAQSKTNIPDEKHPWKKHIKNLEENEYDQKCVAMALSITKLFGQQCMSVDFIRDTNGTLFILEVNSAPGLYSLYYPDEGPKREIALQLLELIIKI